MSDTNAQGRAMKASFSCGWITTVLIVLSILLSTGVWQPTTQIFLWRWLTFTSGHILVPILTIILIPLGIGIIECICMWIFMIVLVLIFGRRR